MTPYWQDPWLTVYEGDCREVMAQMEPESVHCVVTSPPYWGLRDYGIGDGGIGLEPTPEQYVENMVAVFREVRRVLRKDGTCWVNLGDSYAGSSTVEQSRPAAWTASGGEAVRGANRNGLGSVVGLKPKDLVGIPWRVAFALQADGWYLRSDIIWSKPNPMPESVTDRPTKAHEYLFLLTKSPRYYYDADAVREPLLESTLDRSYTASKARDAAPKNKADPLSMQTNGWTMPSAGRNLRTVWTIATQPYPGAHFATFPEALVEPCVKAGTSERGVCPECGAPWVREVDVKRRYVVSEGGSHADGTYRVKYSDDPHDVAFVDRRDDGDGFSMNKTRWHNFPETTGWRPSCAHDLPPIPAIVLDPFAGSGTTGRVAQRLGRKAVLIDLSGEYLQQLMVRNADIPLGLAEGESA